MFKFNSNHILTGQIKQILNSFNLPSYKVYTAQHYKYFLEHGVESPELADGLYIKQDLIMQYKNGKWSKELDTYGYNNKYLNFTRNLPITNNIYDSITHEYLGDFLRFQRDYLGIDMMPLYNCFSKRVCNNITLSIDSTPVIGVNKTIFGQVKVQLDGKDVNENQFAVGLIENEITSVVYAERTYTVQKITTQAGLQGIYSFEDYTGKQIRLTVSEETISLKAIVDEAIIPLETYTYTFNELNIEKIITTDVYGQVQHLRRAFYSKDKDYIIYMLPIKFFKEYTIALDCTTGVEICCGFYNDYLEEVDTDAILIGGQTHLPPVAMSQIISNNTYRKFSTLRYNNPTLWSGINQELFDKIVLDCIKAKTNTLTPLTPEQIYHGYKQRLLERESLLKLFIKIPITQKTSITILEGDYTDFNNAKFAVKEVDGVQTYLTEKYDENGKLMYDDKGKPIMEAHAEPVKRYVWTKQQNKFITNYATQNITEETFGSDESTVIELPEVEDRPFRPISPLQLLMFNTGESYPFSTRLIEYLTGNVITAFDEHTDNIKRAQKVVELNNNKIAFYGAWDGKLRNIFYDYMMNGKPSGEQFGYEINHDTLGYVDKDVEKFYTAWHLEYVLDENGNRIQLTERERDADGNFIRDPETNRFKEVPLYRLVNHLLTEEEKKLLLEKREFILTANDLGTVPLWKQRYVPQGSISTINIYEGEED